MPIAQLVYKEIKEGDLLKLQNESNTAATGGGARDFRFPIRFTSALSAMFPRVSGQVRLGDIQYLSAYGTDVSRDVEFWPEPTDARPTEVRIGRVGTVDAFADPPMDSGERVFLELALDTDGVVTARYVTESALRSTPPLRGVVDELDAALAVTAGSNAVLFAVPPVPAVDTGLSSTPPSDAGSTTAIEGERRTGRRRQRTGREIVPGVPSILVQPDDPESARRLVEATYNYELQERASRGHQRTLDALAEYLRGLGLVPQESNIDAYVAQAEAGVLFEVKSLSASNEREQTRRAVGQLLDYAYFERPAELTDDADVAYAVVYSERPTDDAIDFLDSIGMLALWVGEDGQTIEGTDDSVDIVEGFPWNDVETDGEVTSP